MEYEHCMTMSQAVSVQAATVEDFADCEYPLPIPEGTGWMLLQVLPHPANAKVQQYFWQREVPSEALDDSELATGTEPNITLRG